MRTGNMSFVCPSRRGSLCLQPRESNMCGNCQPGHEEHEGMVKSELLQSLGVRWRNTPLEHHLRSSLHFLHLRPLGCRRSGYTACLRGAPRLSVPCEDLPWHLAAGVCHLLSQCIPTLLA